MPKNLKLKLIFAGVIFSVFPFFAFAVSIGEKASFFVDSSYDAEKRQEISAILQQATNKLYFYIDEKWLNGLDGGERLKMTEALNILAVEFENKIYPVLTSNFGSEWNPGIDKDEKITVLFHPMIETASGYFNTGDEYPRALVSTSNQREMIYLNAANITSSLNKSFLAHELAHLITFNQKDKIYGVSEEIWLNEARAEYAPTLSGYDEQYQNSYLQERARDFLENPQNSLTEWQGKSYDYGATNLFVHYLADHYGKAILIDSLKSEKIGITSLNEALKKNGFKEDFSQIFTNWTIAVLVNDCSFGGKYCYLTSDLNNLRVVPIFNFLPLAGDSVLSITHRATNWAGNWQKIIGGKGTFALEFDGADDAQFKVPYLVCDYQGKCNLDFLNLDGYQKGKITISEFNKKYASVTIVPSVQNKISGFDGEEPFYLFTWKASAVEKTGEEQEAELIKELQDKIVSLKAIIADLQAQIAAISNKEISCGRVEEDKSSSSPFANVWVFENNLYFGLRNNVEVRCLQSFLKSQGSEIYPEGLVTGNYFSLTMAAVIKYQSLKGIIKTGFFGPLTRAAANLELSR